MNDNVNTYLSLIALPQDNGSQNYYNWKSHLALVVFYSLAILQIYLIQLPSSKFSSN